MSAIEDDRTDTGVPVGDAVLSRALDAAGEPVDGCGPLIAPERVALLALPLQGEAAPGTAAMYETGISVIDLFAPITRGGTVLLTGPANVGLLVTLGEWTRRIAERQRGCMVYVSGEERAEQRRDLLHVWAKQRTTPYIVTLFGSLDDATETTPRVLHTAWTVARHFRAAGREVILAVDASRGVPEALAQWSPGAVGASSAITLALVGIVPDEETMRPDPHTPADSRIVFDSALARQHHYPAIAATRSHSRLLDRTEVSTQHREIANAARALLAQAPVPNADTGDARARRLWRYLTQPYFIAEPFTGVQGVYRPLPETLGEIEKILQSTAE